MTERYVRNIPLSHCQHWAINCELHHESQRYFSITGIRYGDTEKILIKQEEIGILGLVFKKHEGRNYFLLQRKEEPGNIPLAQWAPTVQATKSNYERVHKGKSTPYLDFFIDQKDTDVLASEQRSKFLNKLRGWP